MAQNGLGEIKAAEARLDLAKKTKAHSSGNLEIATVAFEAARKALDAAKNWDEDAADYLKAAEAALEAVNKKWELIEIDADDEDVDTAVGKKRAAVERDVDIFEVESILVSGCGAPEVNGTYHRNGMYDNSPQFKHEKHSHILLRRVSYGQWFISREDCTLYKCFSPRDSDEDFSPINKEWNVCSRGVNPAPSLKAKDLIVNPQEDGANKRQRNNATEICVTDNKCGDNDILTAKSVFVKGCGMADVNGTYIIVADTWNGAPYFRNQKYFADMLLRRDQDGFWCISQRAYILYRCISNDNSPFNKDWTVCPHGVNPPPKLGIQDYLKVTDIKSIEVTKCGNKQVNGIYRRTTHVLRSRGYPVFERHCGSVFLSSNTLGTWFITTSTGDSAALYKSTNCEDPSSALALIRNWIACVGSDPPPQVAIKALE
jgi:hypothetical protein